MIELATNSGLNQIRRIGSYLAAAASDYLIASVMSDIGSIGVNMSYLEESQQLAEEGVEYVQLTAGAFKDAGTPYRPY